MGDNRSKRARERAGLSVGQAAKLLGVERGTIEAMEAAEVDDIEEGATTFAGRMAEVYGVNLDWMLGRKPRCDYASLKDVRGWDELSFHDKEVIAEFAASLPPAKPCATCGKVGCHPFRHPGWRAP